MLQNGKTGSFTTTTTTSEQLSSRGVRRLRLTLRPEDVSVGQNDRERSSVHSEGKLDNSSWMKKKGLMRRESPPGRESDAVEKTASNGDVAVLPGLRVYGVVQRSADQELMARDWPANQLQEEMRYIKEVRNSLEKVRERMYGQFGGMQQSIQKLSLELKKTASQKHYLEAEVKSGRAALDSFDQMNSSLISANIDLQKSLLESCQNRVGNREEMKTLRSSFEKTEEKLRERERQLAAANAENRLLKQQIESSQEVNAQTVRDMTAKLQQQFDEQLQEEQRKHRQEVEALRAQLEEYMTRLEEAERNVRLAEVKIAERDQRIGEVERLLDCMAQEKGQLIQKLCECEKRLRSLQGDQVDSAGLKKAEQLQLQKEASELKERIKHLNDMVFSQQRKVKGMIEEVATLRAEVAQKDMYISELLDRLAIVDCENNELEDKLKYFMSVQKAKENKPVTRDVGVGCDLPVSRDEPQSYRAPSALRAPSRLENSLLRYTPLQYSSMLTSYTRETSTSTVETSPSSPTRPNSEEASVPGLHNAEVSSLPSTRTKPGIYTPFMRLMEMTANINID